MPPIKGTRCDWPRPRTVRARRSGACSMWETPIISLPSRIAGSCIQEPPRPRRSALRSPPHAIWGGATCGGCHPGSPPPSPARGREQRIPAACETHRHSARIRGHSPNASVLCSPTRCRITRSHAPSRRSERGAEVCHRLKRARGPSPDSHTPYPSGSARSVPGSSQISLGSPSTVTQSLPATAQMVCL